MALVATTKPEKSPNEGTKVGVFEQGGEELVSRAPNAARSAQVEAGKPVPRAQDVKGTFYCQAGDHIVDHIVWLETITLGCRPCMEKLGKEISREDWTPRLWAVTPEGTKRAKDIPKSPPVKDFTRYQAPVKQARVSPFTCAEQYMLEHQDWSCTRCGASSDKMDGVYNTASGFLCNKCRVYLEEGGKNAKSRKIGQDRETALQRRRREDHERRIAIIARQAGSIPDEPPVVHKNGTGVRIRMKDVIEGQEVSVTGTGSAILIDGDVGRKARVIATGTGCQIVVTGVVHPFAKVIANGTGAKIQCGSVSGSALIQAKGTGARADWKEIPDPVDQDDVEDSRVALARKYDLDYDRRWPEHRDAQLAQIPDLKIAQSTDARPSKGKVGEWVYVRDLDQLFTWMQDAGWIQVALPAPPETDRVARGSHPRTVSRSSTDPHIVTDMLDKLRVQHFGPPFSQRVCYPGQHEYLPGQSLCDTCGTATLD